MVVVEEDMRSGSLHSIAYLGLGRIPLVVHDASRG